MVPDPTVIEVVTAWFAAATRGDASILDRHLSLSRGTRLVGSDASEWLQGGDAIGAFLRREILGAGGAVKFSPGDVEGYSHGDVGWAATRLTISLPDGSEVSPRWTAVMMREGEGWKIVQTHASIAVGNTDVGWTYDDSAQ